MLNKPFCPSPYDRDQNVFVLYLDATKHHQWMATATAFKKVTRIQTYHQEKNILNAHHMGNSQTSGSRPQNLTLSE